MSPRILTSSSFTSVALIDNNYESKIIEVRVRLLKYKELIVPATKFARNKKAANLKKKIFSFPMIYLYISTCQI